jgi:hypothetical protein
LSFRSHGLKPYGRNAVIPSALIIQFRIWPLVGLLNQTRSEHTVQAAVERAWTETEGTIRVVTHVAHDGVTMPFAIRERQQDVKHRWRQRQHRIGARNSSHIANISVTDILAIFALFVKIKSAFDSRLLVSDGRRLLPAVFLLRVAV